MGEGPGCKLKAWFCSHIDSSVVNFFPACTNLHQLEFVFI